MLIVLTEFLRLVLAKLVLLVATTVAEALDTLWPQPRMPS
jgi:hypothetical protein